MLSMTVASDLCRNAGAPPQNTPDFGGPTDFSVIFSSKLDPQNRGILRGAPALMHKSEATVIESTPHIS